MSQVNSLEEKTTFTVREAKVTISEITDRKRHIKDESGEEHTPEGNEALKYLMKE
jgi:hypothetical protein